MQGTALVTGCSSGIGRATARAFLDDGWEVYATSRDPGELTALEESGAVIERLDVASDADVDRVVGRLLDEQGRIDCLVNNAGYGQIGPVEDVPVDAVREQYEVNLFGPRRLMRAVLPRMREQESGTIVNVSSISDRFPFAGSGAYNASKSALTTLSQTLRQEVSEYGVDVVVIEPSFVATEFFGRMIDELDDFDRTPAYADLYRLLEQLRVLEGGGPGVAPPEAAAETILEAANGDDPKRRYSVGSLAAIGTVLAAVIPPSWRTPAMRAGVSAATSGPARRLLDWWNGR